MRLLKLFMRPEKTENAELPKLFLQRMISHLNRSDILVCRLVCRSWNVIIVNSGLLRGTSDYFFSLRPHSNKLQALLYPQKTLIRDLQYQYVFNRKLFPYPAYTSLTILNIDVFPSFAEHFNPSFKELLSSVTSLTITLLKTGLVSDINMEQINAILSPLSGSKLRRLSVPSLILQEISEETCTEKFQSLSHINIQMTSNNYLKEIPNIAKFLVNPALREFRNLIITYVPENAENGEQYDTIFEIVNKYSKLLHENYMIDMLKSALALHVLKLDICGLPLNVFDQTGFLMLILFMRIRGLKHLSLSLTGDVLSPSLATTLSTLLKEWCDVTLHIRFKLENMDDHIRNNLVLSLPEVALSIQSFQFLFTQTFVTNAVENGSYCLRHFFPKYENLDHRMDLVKFSQLKSLSIKFESSRGYIFLDFLSIASQVPLLEEIEIFIPQEKQSLLYRILPFHDEGVHSNLSPSELRMIFMNFPFLKKIFVSAPMPFIDDDTFSGQVKGLAVNLKTISELLPDLERLTLQGLGTTVTSKSLASFHGMTHLNYIQMSGQHKICSKAVEELLTKVPTLYRHNVKLS